MSLLPRHHHVLDALSSSQTHAHAHPPRFVQLDRGSVVWLILSCLSVQVVSLVAKILPPVPTEAAVPSAAPSSVAAAAASAAAAQQQGEKDVAAERQAAQAQRVQFLQQNPALLEKFSRDLLPPLLHVSTCWQPAVAVHRRDCNLVLNTELVKVSPY